MQTYQSKIDLPHHRKNCWYLLNLFRIVLVETFFQYPQKVLHLWSAYSLLGKNQRQLQQLSKE